MCLTTQDPKIKIATKNILVYKTGRLYPDGVFASEYKGYKYTLGEKTREERLIPLCGVFGYEVQRGYHSYNEGDSTLGRSNGLFIIPKGAQYIEGYVNDIPVDNRVSDTIIYIGGRYNLLTWLRYWFKYKN